jgi:hypothetical protein
LRISSNESASFVLLLRLDEFQPSLRDSFGVLLGDGVVEILEGTYRTLLTGKKSARDPKFVGGWIY